MALIDSLISYYKMDDNLATTVVLDAHGANNGVCTVNTNTISAGGIINTSLDFPNNVATRVSIADGGSLSFSPGTDEYSISVWVYRDGSGDYDTIIMNRNTGDGDFSYRIWINPSNKIRFDSYDFSPPTSLFEIISTATVGTGAWHHIVGTVSTTTAKLYLDGVYINTDNVDSRTLQENLGVSIGVYRGVGWEHPFNGKTDELGIWGKVLSDGGVALTETATGEVAELYGTGSPPAYPFTAGTNIKINIGDVHKDVSEMKINIGDTWKAVTQVKQNIGDAWKTVY